MTHSALLLAQIQYFFGLGFLLLFLALELGLVWGLLLFKLKTVFTKTAFWQDTYRFWVRVFALVHFLSFAAFIAAIIQSIALWPNLIQRIGDVIGPLIAIAFACMFIIKAGVLSVMLFNARRLHNFIHTLTVAIVAVGVTVFSMLVISMLGWLQTPNGAIVFDNKYVVTNTLATFLNPALDYYGLLFVSISLLLVSVLYMVLTVGQAKYNPINNNFISPLKKSFAIALFAVLACGLSVSGLVKFAAQYQPAKAAATVGHWNSNSSPDLYLFAIPNQELQQNQYASKINGAADAWLFKDDSGENVGLDQYSGMTPPVTATFWFFRLIVMSLILLPLLLAWSWLLYKKHNYNVLRMPKMPYWILISTGVLATMLLYFALAYVQFGSLPYAVYASITFAEVFVLEQSVQLLVTNMLFLICYGVLIFGFIVMLRHIARHGVIPITRRRII